MVSRTRSRLIDQVAERYEEYEKWFAAEARKGLKQTEAGQLVEHETVARKWGRKRAVKLDSRR